MKPKRADAQRNENALLSAAAAVFVRSGVEAPIREIAAEAGVGTATIYRHFPTRADLIVAVYRHQVEALAESGPVRLETAPTPYAALQGWFGEFVGFVITKQGLAAVLQSDDPCYDPLHAYFLERLEPVCTRLLTAAASSGEIRSGQDAQELMRGVGGLCAGAGTTPRYDPRRMVELLISGLRQPD
ncbi:TetR/AcrR family transcriptional regulator [Cryptosporangium arvum]|uniref:TetR/AcrR family transcriptional regulator n=1 Tax=Cryptosporangium arvum TaxID=80871 RepID=UPI0004AE0CD3|nr:TetR/AcrR family transcriptional regulator [Cryptosporangium arvum]